MADPIDWNDPCQRADALRKARWRLVSGQQESEFTYQGNGVQRTVKYSQADLTALLDEIRDAEAACATSRGDPPPRRRFALQGGARRFR